MIIQKIGDRWTATVRRPDGTRLRTSAHATKSDAAAAGTALEQQPHAFREGRGDEAYYVGRYRLPDGQWAETPDGFDAAEDAVAEARELEQAARTGLQAGA